MAQHNALIDYTPTYRSAVATALTQRQRDLQRSLATLHHQTDQIADAARLLVDCLRSGHMVFAAGNGGSAAQAQHFAAELVGRFKRERDAYAALSLTTDTSILTAIGNDYGYEDVFARQVRGLGNPDDVLLLLSTSGESENLVRAAITARQRGMSVLALTGRPACRVEMLSAITICVPARESALVQEMHLLVIHLLCDLVERSLSETGAACD